MREETELKWAVNLISSSKITNTLIKIRGGTYSDFEKYAQSSSRSSEFRKWFNKFLKLKIIEFMEYYENSKGNPSKLYTLNKTNLLDYLNENNSLYKNTYKAVLFDFTAINR